MSTVSQVVAVGDVRPIKREDDPPQGLTSIHRRIQCSATRDTIEGEYSETDMIVISNFLNTLAEVALAVAARQSTMKTDDQG